MHSAFSESVMHRPYCAERKFGEMQTVTTMRMPGEQISVDIAGRKDCLKSSVKSAPPRGHVTVFTLDAGFRKGKNMRNHASFNFSDTNALPQHHVHAKRCSDCLGVIPANIGLLNLAGNFLSWLIVAEQMMP